MKSRIVSKTLGGLAAAGILGLLAGCSEQPQVVVYEQGKYHGKADAAAWEGSAFKGDRAAWEQALNNRVRKQNEYNRVE